MMFFKEKLKFNFRSFVIQFQMKIHLQGKKEFEVSNVMSWFSSFRRHTTEIRYICISTVYGNEKVKLLHKAPQSVEFRPWSLVLIFDSADILIFIFDLKIENAFF